MKRTLSLLMAVLMLTAVVLTGCTSGGTTSGCGKQQRCFLCIERSRKAKSSAAEENDLLAQIKEKGSHHGRDGRHLGCRGHTTIPMITLSAMT